MNTKQNEIKICPYCSQDWTGRKGFTRHTTRCKVKYDFIKTYNFTKESLDKELDKVGSILAFTKKYTAIYKGELSDSIVRSIFSNFGIDTSIKRACNSEQSKKLRRETNLKRYGVPHNFCKNSESRKKWEARLFNEEGITNVFQRESVKQKIIQTVIEKYGENGAAYNRGKANTLEYWVNKLGEKLGTERYKKICFEKGKSNRIEYYIEKYGEEQGRKIFEERIKRISCSCESISSLSHRVEKILVKNSIKFESEFPLSNNGTTRFYDFKIGSYLLELNGDYWHANPNIYKESDIIHYPNGLFLKAKQVWDKDIFKKQLGELYFYNVVYIWESDMNKMSDKQLFRKIKALCNI